MGFRHGTSNVIGGSLEDLLDVFMQGLERRIALRRQRRLFGVDKLEAV